MLAVDSKEKVGARYVLGESAVRYYLHPSGVM